MTKASDKWSYLAELALSDSQHTVANVEKFDAKYMEKVEAHIDENHFMVKACIQFAQMVHAIPGASTTGQIARKIDISRNGLFLRAERLGLSIPQMMIYTSEGVSQTAMFLRTENNRLRSIIQRLMAEKKQVGRPRRHAQQESRSAPDQQLGPIVLFGAGFEQVIEEI